MSDTPDINEAADGQSHLTGVLGVAASLRHKTCGEISCDQCNDERDEAMVLLFEVAGPFRWKPKVERIGALTRIIWGCFSVARVTAGFNDIAQTFREDERQKWVRQARRVRNYSAPDDVFEAVPLRVMNNERPNFEGKGAGRTMTQNEADAAYCAPVDCSARRGKVERSENI